MKHLIFFSLVFILSACSTAPKLSPKIKEKINSSIYHVPNKDLFCKVTTSIYNTAAKTAQASKMVTQDEFRVLNNYYMEILFSKENFNSKSISLDPIPKLKSTLGETRYRPFFNSVEKILKWDLEVMNTLFMYPSLNNEGTHYLVSETDTYYEIKSKNSAIKSSKVYKDFSKLEFNLLDNDSVLVAKLTKEGDKYYITSIKHKNEKKDASFELYFNYLTKNDPPVPVAALVKKKDFDIELSYGYSFNSCSVQ